MTFSRRKQIEDLNKYLAGLLTFIETDEKEIRRLQDRLRENIGYFRAAMAERDAAEKVGLENGEIS